MWRFGLTTSKVLSALIVQTVARELVQVPTSGPCAVGAFVAHAFKSRRKTPVKRIRKEGCVSWLASCLIATEGQAQIAAKVACKELPALNTKQRGTATARFLLDRKSFQLAQFFLAFSRALLGRGRTWAGPCPGFSPGICVSCLGDGR